MLMVGEKRSGWAIQGFKIMHMKKSKGQRTSGWSILKFKKYANESIQRTKDQRVVNMLMKQHIRSLKYILLSRYSFVRCSV